LCGSKDLWLQEALDYYIIRHEQHPKCSIRLNGRNKDVLFKQWNTRLQPALTKDEVVKLIGYCMDCIDEKGLDEDDCDELIKKLNQL